LREVDGRAVVIKAINTEYPSSDQIARLRREYRITAAVRAPGVIQMLALERYRNSVAIVMEDIGGESLLRLQQGRPMPLKDFLHLAIELAETLGEVHKQRVMHKDVTPGNIVWAPKTRDVRLIDFGIATELPQETSATVSPSVLEGTLLYMSPEQTGRMNRAIDYRTDLYSLGATFYHLLTGEPPFSADDPLELVHCHIAKEPRPPHELRPEVPEVVSAIVLKLLAKHAEARYQSGFTLKSDLEKCFAGADASGKIAPFPIALGDASDRFQLPQWLYGREREIRLLLEGFERVSEGGSEAMFVAGFSGIGKSSLVSEVHRPIARRRGYFVSGKFDQFQRNIPYASLTQAFRELVRQLLTEPPESLARWRERILAALRPNAQVIIDVIHEVELITGPQPPVPELPPQEAENRLNFTFEKLFGVFRDKSHPLVMFLDDLQWADLPSFKLLSRLLSDPETRYLYFIGAYRDNEVDGQHPLLMMQAELRKAAAPMSTITLGPLSREHCAELLRDTLKSDLEAVMPLAELCVQRTGGNPFFLSQYLLALHREGMFAFDARSGRFRWDLDRLKRAQIAGNVVDLMAAKIKVLEEDAQRELKLAACVGASFDLATLAVVSSKTPEDAAAALWPALREGLVLPLTEAYKFTEDRAAVEAMLGRSSSEEERIEPRHVAYRFLHDRVQQAAYSLVPEADRPALHLQVGRLLRDATPPSRLDERLFAIVNQLNAGAELIADEEERASLAEMNLAACRKARDSAAYGAAVAYVKAGIRLLDQGAWERRHDLMLSLHLQAAEASYLNADATDTEQFVKEALAHATDVLERVKAYEIRIQALMTQTRMVDALETGREILEQLGVVLPEDPTPADMMAALQSVEEAIGQRSTQELAALPPIEDPRVLSAVRILTKMTSSSYLAKPSLFPLVVLRQLRLALEHGNTGACAFGYVLYGLLRIAVLGDIEGGYAFGPLAEAVLERFNAKEYETRTRACVAAFLTHWREPIRATVEAFTENYRRGFETGDIEYTAWSGKHATVNAYLMGEDLAEIRQMAARYVETLSRFKQDAIVQYIRTTLQVAESLMSDDPEPWQLVGPGYDFKRVIEAHLAARDAAGVSWAYVHRLLLCTLFGRTEEALEALAVFEANASGSLGMLYVPVVNLYASLTWLAACEGAPEQARGELVAKVEANQRQMKVWAEHAPWNRAHAYALVEAELSRVRGEREQARRLYYRAMELAREHGNKREEALATELFARFLIACGEVEAAQLFMAKASHLYELWGARSKARHIERRYPAMLRRSGGPQKPAPEAIDASISTTQGSPEVIDLWSVVRASQAISGAVVLPELLRQIMLAVIQNAGARRGLLYVPGARPHVVEVNSAVNGEPEVAIREGSIDEREDVSRAIVRYVQRAREPVVLHDAASQGEFQSDPDVLRNRSRSVLCLPVLRHKELAGVLYLENELAPGAFTKERCRVLELLSAQAAISLENARLYETLENRVRERTRELEEALESLRATQRQLVAQEKLASLGMLTSGIAHELKNPLNFVINFAKLSTELAEELQRELSKPSAELRGDAEYLGEIAADLAQNASKISHHGRRADEIVRSMLQHAGSASGQREQIDLNSVVRDAVRLASEGFRIQRRGPSVRVETALHDGSLLAEITPQEIGRVVLNLVSNACYVTWQRATRESGFVPSVVVSTRDAGDSVEIRVEDNGTGIPASAQEKIFVPFFTTKPAGDGTGLGLSLSHDIVTGHNGAITFTTREGEGTAFVVRLPKRSKSPAAAGG
jgi:predicted ATPase/signal transduction histidine kinase/tRNA A-37 threonylcarbamoyl transferase component Bud32